MTKRSGIEGVVKDGLIRGRNLKNIFEDESGFTSRDAQRDVKGEGEAEGVKRISDVKDERGLFRRTMS